MEYWEFLIQKEGDRNWQTLQSSDLTLEEGRYRLVVRTARKDAEVDLRIVYESTQESPPRRRMQKRSRRTNLEGLMVIVPYTYLKPGIWEFRCRPDLLEDLMGDSWQQNVRLQVQPKAIAATPEAEGEDSGVSLAELGEFTESADPIEQSVTPTAPEPEKAKYIDPWLPVFSSKVERKALPALLLTLKQDTYFADRGKPINLSGRVELPTTAANEPAEAEAVLVGELKISLRDPQNGQILAERRQNIPPQQIPFNFSFDIQIPANSQTRLFLGEIALYNATETPTDSPLLLASKSFTITADLNELLSAIADNFTESETLELPANQSKGTVLDLSTIESNQTPKIVEFKPLQPSSGAVLPPLLYQPDPFKKPSKSLDLPAFGRKISPPIPPANTQAETEAKPEVSEVSEEILSPSEAEIVTDAATETTADIEADIDPNQTEEVENVPLSPDDIAFQSLQLKSRFLSRLNAFASDAELLSELRIDDVLEEESNLADTNATSLPTDPSAYEIVVDDEPIEPLPIPTTRSLKRKSINPKETVPPEVSPPPSDEPIPVPQLEVPQGELIAGEPVRIRVKMPMREPRLAVKLWVVDLQTRSTIELPRWVGDFFPDPWGDLEATTQITVPIGCLAIRIEAMATELLTKRESHKTSVDRTVIPPNLPNYSEE